MTLSTARRVVLAFVVMVSTWGCAIGPIKTIDIGDDGRADADFRCRLQDHGSTVTLAFDESNGSCTLNPLSEKSVLKTKRLKHAHFELCNACEHDIDVTLDVGTWDPLPGPWFLACAADKVNLDEEQVTSNIKSKNKRHIICDIKDKDRGKGETRAHYTVEIAAAGKRPVLIKSPNIKVEDN
jgi:hypothetical protein